MAKFTKLSSGVWGVRLTADEHATASADARVEVPKADGTKKTVTLAGLVETRAVRGVVAYADWALREERKVYAGRGRPRVASRRDYVGASLASQTAPYDLAEATPAGLRERVLAVADLGLGYADALAFAAAYEPDEDVWPNVLAKPSRLVGLESTLTRE